MDSFWKEASNEDFRLDRKKKELGYTNEMISEKSGVPISTVNKIFGGFTEKPRYNTLQSIECVLFPEIHSPKEAALYKDIVENLALDWGNRVAEGAAIDEYNFEPLRKEEVIGEYERLLSRKKAGEFTVSDLDNLPEGMIIELIDGVIYDRNTPTKKHQLIVTQLSAQLDAAKDKVKGKRKDCLVLVAPTGVRLSKEDEKNRLIPDILMVCDKAKYNDKEEEDIIGAPDLVIEVLSPSTEKHDTFVKFNKYWAIGVREYWIIDVIREEIFVYNFEKRTVPKTYSFEDSIPLEISAGAITIDFKSINDSLKNYFG